MAFVHLGNLPNPPRARVINIENLQGGLNIHDIPWGIKANQSSEMRNMWWVDGALRTRPGITAYNNDLIVPRDNDLEHDFEDIRSYSYAYQGWYVICNPGRGVFTAIAANNFEYYRDLELPVAHMDGSFFIYNNILYYKSKGGFYKIYASNEMDYNAGAPVLIAEEVQPYEPTTYINAVPVLPGEGDPQFGGADFYQPKNRLSYARIIKYTCSETVPIVVIPEPTRPVESGGVTAQYIGSDGVWREIPVPQVVNHSNRTELLFPDNELGTALTAAGTAGLSNNVRIRYLVPETDDVKILYDSVMGCNITTVFGGSTGMFVLMSGYEGQPNAFFWCGNTDISLDPSYFPVENFNLIGDISDPITAFGKQQNMLIVFQKRQIGRCVYEAVNVDGRTFPAFNYRAINPMIGCDIPGSIQLIENNLVFANTSQGVMFLKDSSSVYENNIVTISHNVERPRRSSGLLYDLSGSSPDSITSIDDGKRYWLFAGEHAWLWDYSLGGEINNPEALSWFYFDTVPQPACWLRLDDNDGPDYIGKDGYYRRWITTLLDTNYRTTTESDPIIWRVKGQDFEKELVLPIQDFGTYEVLKSVQKCIFVIQGSGNTFVDVTYETDYGITKEKTPLYIPGQAVLVPRNLAFRSLHLTAFATTAVRRPRCINIRHFKVILKNDKRGDEISVISAQIFYTLQGRDR